MPDATGLELIAHDLREQVPGRRPAPQHYRGIATLIVDPERVIDALEWLRDTPNQTYDFLASLHASDYLPAVPRFGVHYELLNMDRVERLHVKALLEEPEDGRCPSSTPASASSRPPTSRSGRRTTCSASPSAATPTCGAS